MSKKLSKKGIAAICALPLLAGLIGFVPLFSMVKPTPPGPEPEPESGDVKIKEKEKDAPTGEVSASYEATFENESLPDYNEAGERHATVYIVNKEGQQYNVQFVGQPVTEQEYYGMDVVVQNGCCNIPIEFIDDVTDSTTKITSYFNLVFEYKINKVETQKIIKDLTLTFTPIPQDVVYVPYKTQGDLDLYWETDTYDGDPRVLGLKQEGLDYIEANNCNSLIIPANHRVKGCNGLPEKIKTVYFCKPDKVILKFDGSSFCDCNGLEKIVFPSFENNIQISRNDWYWLYFNESSFDSKNLKTIDVSRWNKETIQNISYSVGDYLGGFDFINPVDGTIPKLILPKETGNKEDDNFIKAGIYKIFKGSDLRDDAFANSGIDMTIANEGPFKTASLGSNKIIIGLNEDYVMPAGQTTWTIPKGTTDLLVDLFYDNDIPESIKTIDFSQTQHINSIGFDAFYKVCVPEILNLPIMDACCCGFEESYIRKITFQQDLNITSIPYLAFCLCYYLTDIELPATLKKIDQSAFEEVAGLLCYNDESSPISNVKSGINIHLPEGLINIEEDAFYGAAISKINIPTSLKQIGNDALYTYNYTVFDFTQFENFDEIPEGWKTSYPFGGDEGFKILLNNKLAEESVTNITEFLSDYCRITSDICKLETLSADDFSYNVDDNGNLVITGLNITPESDVVYDVSIPATAFVDGQDRKVVAIDEDSFKEKIFINKLDLSNATNLMTIGSRAFEKTHIFDPIEFPNSIECVGQYAFNETYTPSIILNASKDNGCKYDQYCFYNPINLLKISVNSDSGSITLCNGAFEYCYALSELELSKKIQSIGLYAFYYGGIVYDIKFTGFEDEDDIPSNWNDGCFYDDGGYVADWTYVCWINVLKKNTNFAKKAYDWMKPKCHSYSTLSITLY